MNDALKIEKIDNVAVVIRPITKGETVICRDHEGETITVCAASDIPIYHKIALQDFAQGAKIVKYGEHIGEASQAIRTGAHVHTHNVASVREDLREDQ